MKAVWLSAEQVTQLTGWALRTVLHKAKIDEIETRRSAQISKNGKRPLEFALRSLPLAAQKKALTMQLTAAAESVQALALKPETTLQAPLPFKDPDAVATHDRIQMSPEQKKEADRRSAVVEAFHQAKNRGRDHTGVLLRTVEGRELRTSCELADYLAEQNNITRNTLFIWYARYKKSGYGGLVRRSRRDKGKDYFKKNKSLASFAQKKYLAERLSISMVREALVRECGKRSVPPPSYETLRAYLKAIPRPVTIIAREGEREYHDRCELFLLKKYTDRLANDVWVSDHMLHDCWVRNNLFNDHPRDAAIRPWLTAIIDYRSRKAVGYVWCATPSSDTISAALRMALSKYGPPQTFYIDNGKDYRSLSRENALSPQASGVLVRLGVESQYCQPRHPQSKHIERWFNTLHQRFDIQWRPFYSGTSPKNRPEECDDILAEHKKLMKMGAVDQSPLPLASEFVQMAATWIAEDYNANHAHSGRGMDGKTPDEVFNAEYPEGQRRACDPRALDILLRRREVRVVREGGCVEINGQRYEPADAASSAAMTLQIERKALVLCDPANMGEAVVLDMDNNYLGTLHASRLMEHGPVSREAIRNSIRQRRQVRKALKGYVGGLIERSYARGEQSEMEILRDRAGLGPAVPRVQRARALPAVSAAIGRAAAAPIGYEDFVTDYQLSEGKK